uniref:Uncharacterized protein n=1 Tax=Panagrolaimus sp. PS1159 TaxID=55785 RepID=A0AC35GI26_9BILA
MNSVLLFLCIFALINTNFAILCYRFTQNGQDYVAVDGQLNSCPVDIKQCFKFVCTAQTSFVTRGCVNYNDPPTQPDALRAQCAARNGYGSYYTCNDNRCNSAEKYNLTPLLLPFSFFFIIFLSR